MHVCSVRRTHHLFTLSSDAVMDAINDAKRLASKHASKRGKNLMIKWVWLPEQQLKIAKYDISCCLQWPTILKDF